MKSYAWMKEKHYLFKTHFFSPFLSKSLAYQTFMSVYKLYSNKGKCIFNHTM